LRDQPHAVNQKGMPRLIPVQLVHELNRPPPLETEQPLDRRPIHNGDVEDTQRQQDLGKS
jgi:hypothetical protein